jgi:hypothetical protein
MRLRSFSLLCVYGENPPFALPPNTFHQSPSPVIHYIIHLASSIHNSVYSSFSQLLLNYHTMSVSFFLSS